MAYGEIPLTLDPIDRDTWKVEDRESANYALEAIAAASKQSGAIEELYQNTLKRLNKNRDEMLKKYVGDIEFFTKQAEEWARQEIGEGKAGKIELLSGEVGFSGDPPEFYLKTFADEEE